MRHLILFALIVASVGCASEAKPPGKYPAREPGCDVQLFPEEPTYPTENIGSVRASCDEAVSEPACERELKDQACKLGAETVWGVDSDSQKTGKRSRSGRAAHRK